MGISSELRPKLRNEIVFGPPEPKGNKTLYYVGDRYTGQFYRLGEKEFFLLNEMDGNRTLQNIAMNYEARFGRQLGEQGWANLFRLLDARQMLDGQVNPERLEELKETAARNKHKATGLFKRNFRLVDPNSALDSALPFVRFLFSPAFVAVAVAAIVAVEAWVLSNLKIISADAWQMRGNWKAWGTFFGTTLVCAALHETAHGLACKRFGGNVREMGVTFRYFWFFPYCKLDDIVLFHNRWHRVYVAAAGVFVSLLLLVPFAVLWWATPPGTLAHGVSAKMLTLYNVVTLVNFIPFIQLDGYFMLAHALRMSELRKESYQFVKRMLFNPGEFDDEYTLREKRIYAVYGLLSIMMTLFWLLMMSLFWQSLLSAPLGGAGAWVTVLAMIVLMVAGRRLWHRAGATIKAYRSASEPVRSPVGPN